MFEAYPVELRPVLTRHRLRRRRHRSAATLLTGAALALGLAATRPAVAGAATTGHAAQRALPLHRAPREVPAAGTALLRRPAHTAPGRPP